MNFQEYISTPGVSNSALNALQKELYPQQLIINSQDALNFGKLFESRVQDTPMAYSNTAVELARQGDLEQVERMYAALCKEKIAITVMHNFDRQVPFFSEVEFSHDSIRFSMSCKCLFDWFFRTFGGDLKTFSGGNFESACKRFGWVESRVFYMLVAKTDRDFLIGVSKEKRPKVWVKHIHRGTEEFKTAYKNICKKAYDYYILKY